MSNGNTKWTSVWGNAPSYSERSTAEYAKDTSLRYHITPTLDGSAIRLHFHNLFGQDDITISKVSLALADDHRTATKDTLIPVTFQGNREVNIAKGTVVCSDELSFTVKANQPLVISLYLKDFTDMTSAVSPSGPLSHQYFAKGDFCDTDEWPIDRMLSTKYVYFLYQIDVLANENTHAIIAFGDSITAQSWPEWLTKRILDSGAKTTAVVRRGIGGNRILREYQCHQTRHYGPSGLNRFARDIQAAGADTVIVLHGINDIIHPEGTNPFRPLSHLPTAEQMIEGLRFYVHTAHEHHMKIYLATILPFEGWRTYSPERETIRIAVNTWIRGNSEADGFIDFDAALRDPEHPTAIKAPYFSPDHLHPSYDGAQEMANTVPESLFL